MSANHHSGYADGVTSFSAADMNPPLKELDAVASIVARGGRLAAADKDLSTPPVGPADLAAYIVGGSATGAWTGQENKIAYYDSDKTAWKFIAPAAGLTVYVADESTEYQYSGSAWAKKMPYIVAAFYPGSLENDALCLRHTLPLPVDFPAGLTGSYSKAGTAATAQTVFDIKKNGSSVGSITFAASGVTGTLAMSSATSFAAGDVLTIVGPSTADATLADVDFSLKGSR